MAWTAPSVTEVAARSAQYGLGLSDEDVKLYSELGAAMAGAHDEIAAWFEEVRPPLPTRSWTRPAPADNPYNAWYVQGKVAGAPAGPLADLRWVAKSSISVAGWPMSAGSLLVEGHTPAEDAAVVRLLLAAGATLVGNANAEDLGVSASSYTSALGPVTNPWDAARATFGSSSGCAALVCAGLVDFGIGGDQGGSVRAPASGTGLVGHKPSRGLVPYTGAMAFTAVQDGLGPLTRTSELAARVMAELDRPDGRDLRQCLPAPGPDWLSGLHDGVRGLRIGLVRESFGVPGLSEPAVDDTVRAACDRLAAAGASVREVSVPVHTRGGALAMVIITHAGVRDMLAGNLGSAQSSLDGDPDLVSHVATRRAAHPKWLADTVRFSSAAGTHPGDRAPGWHLAAAMRLAAHLTAAYDRALSEVDVLVTPTVPYLPRVLPDDATSREDWIGSALDMVVNTSPFNVTGHPATSVPAGLVNGLPVGMQVIAARGADPLCLRVAQAMEELDGGFPGPVAQ